MPNNTIYKCICNETEEWKDVPNYKGYYQVSNIGRVRSLDRIIRFPYNKLRIKKGVMLKQSTTTGSGYKSVFLHNGGDNKRYYVHRLVLMVFVGCAPKGYDCRHIDGDRSNNNITNLKWGTRKENCQDTIKHGRTTTGEKNKHSKLKESEVLEIRKIIKTKKHLFKEIADKFSVSVSTISGINRGHSWAWLK